ncbi:MAG: hypothetical protein LBJ43_01180 [Propionibacteriaceae bacterium]|jgi:hypothetical protein|nr:hypothetical protein [Propionibacteriaceae bacterium]
MFYWHCVDDSGNRIAKDDEAEIGLDELWDSREAAVTWLGQIWEELLFYGIDEVSLYENDELVLGPMKLIE